MSELGKGDYRSLAPKTPGQAWRRRIGALVIAGGVVFTAVEVTEAIVQANDSIPAGCDVTVPKNGTVWGVASQIAEHAHQPVDQVDYEIGRANPGVSLGQVDAWQTIGIPEEYCNIVEQNRIGQ